MKNVARFLVSQGLVAGILVLLACSNLYGDTVVRTLSPDGPDTSGGAFLLAPGYCSSYGGSHLYEYISSVDVVQIGEILTITVYVWIANPTGCTAGSPCPEYDGSPEYINVWIDWDGDEVWESNERVMDEALTGYLGINYQGTMTATRQVTIPPSAVPTTWLRANLGWGHDPNNPCEYSWTWGDVHDLQVAIEKSLIRVKELHAYWDVPIEGVSNTVWSQAYDGDGNPLGDPVQKPIADAMISTFNSGKFRMRAKLEGFPDFPSGDIEAECNWAIYPFLPNGAAIKVGKGSFTGQDGGFLISVPRRIGRYALELDFKFKDEDDNIIGAQSIALDKLFTTYTDFLAITRTVKRLNKACWWASGAGTRKEAVSRLKSGIYAQSGWDYVDPGCGWEDLVEDRCSEGNCVRFANVWHNLSRVLGIAGTDLAPQQFGAHGDGFVTKKPAVALDGKPGNAYPEGSDFASRDRWRFRMHSVGRYGSRYYDPTFGKTYSTDDEYIEWDQKGDFIYDGASLYCFAVKGETEYVIVYARTPPLGWGWRAYEYFGPYPGQPPAAPPVRGGDLLASLSGAGGLTSPMTAGASFTGTYSDSALDTDGDGVGDVLAVEAEVEVTLAGRYVTFGYLSHGDSVISSRPSNISSIPSMFDFTSDPGLQTVELTFSGEDILRSGVDGPYDVHLVLLDESSSVTDTLTFSTRPYTHSQFGEVSARVTSCSDQGTDPDGNGLYDYLTVNITTTATVAMCYAIGGILMSDTLIISTASDTSSLGVGDDTVTLNFSGPDIRESGIDGPYSLVVIIYDQGETPIFRKECSTSDYSHLSFEPKKGKLQGYLDYGQDFDGNGLYDVLRVEISVEVEEPGTYLLSGWLADATGQEIGFTQSSSFVGASLGTLVIDFDGIPIFENAEDGPYILAYACLERDDGSVLDEEVDAHHTAPYSHLSFERPIPPLVALTGTYEDSGEDSDGDGLFDYLTVALQVTCSDAGVVVGNARLLDPDGEEVSWSTGYVPVAENEPTMLPLDFDGRYIWACLLDGAFRLQDLLVYHTGDPNQSVYIPEPYVTASYDHTAFERSAVIAGTVSDKGIPVLGALLSVQGVDYDYTNSGGDYNLTVLQGGHYTVTIEDPGGYEIDSWLIYVNDALVGEGHSVQVECTVGVVTDVDFKTSIPADIDIDPNTLNLGSWGRCVTCYIELPSEYDVFDIDVSTVSFNNQVNAMLKPTQIGDYDDDGIPDLMVKFHRPSVQEILVVGDSVAVTVNGKVGTAAFEGMDTIRVIDPSPSVKGNESPGAFSLCQNYPNPFNPKTKISYVLPNACHVNISIYNLLGQRVATIVNEYQTTGHRTVPWDAKDENSEQVASGVFFYRIQAGDFVQSKKMVLMK